MKWDSHNISAWLCRYRGLSRILTFQQCITVSESLAAVFPPILEASFNTDRADIYRLFIRKGCKSYSRIVSLKIG